MLATCEVCCVCLRGLLRSRRREVCCEGNGWNVVFHLKLRKNCGYPQLTHQYSAHTFGVGFGDALAPFNSACMEAMLKPS